MTDFAYHTTEISILLKQLEYAAVYPESRMHFIKKALISYNRDVQVAGSAVIFYHEQEDPPISYMYAGTNEEEMHDWLHNRLNVSGEMIKTDMKQGPVSLEDFQTNVWPFPNQEEPIGLFMEWFPSQVVSNMSKSSLILPYLKALADVMRKEKLYFSNSRILRNQEWVELVQQKDPDGLKELLTMTQSIMGSDMVFWGDTNHKYVEITNHVGALRPGFGFQLPIGQGIGGNAASKRNIIQVDDYRNCGYRYEEVTNAVDSEDIRSGFAIPFLDAYTNPTGILYASRRKVEPFSLTQNLLLQRVRNIVDPITQKRPSKKLYTAESFQSLVTKKKKELRTLLLQARNIQEIEVWLEDLVKGNVTIVDDKGNPYNKSASLVSKPADQPMTFNLHQTDETYQGKILMWPGIALPMKDWPEAKEDIVNACQIVLEREEKQQRVQENQKASWFKDVLQDPNQEQLFYEGLRLGLPVEQGEIWYIEWDEKSSRTTQRMRSELEEVALRLFKSPLIFFESSAILLLNETKTYHTPETFRDHLLKALPVATWVVHGATYTALNELKNAFYQSEKLMKRLQDSADENYILEIDDYRLNSLLDNPSLHEYLEKFTYKMLLPVLEYDQHNDTQLTKTLALAIILEKPSLAAERLFIHTNTVHYRTRRAKEILQLDVSLPENDVALKLAAYIYLRKYHPEMLQTESEKVKQQLLK